MSTDETREALTAAVREGEAAGMYADHGAAGFCTDHGQAADRPTIMAEAVEAGARVLFVRHANTTGPDLGTVFDADLSDDLKSPFRRDSAAVLAAVGYAPGLEEALGRVLLDHQPGPGYPWDRSAPITLTAAACWCGWTTPAEHFGWRLREWHRKHVADHLADVVRAWLRGETT